MLLLIKDQWPFFPEVHSLHHGWPETWWAAIPCAEDHLWEWSHWGQLLEPSRRLYAENRDLKQPCCTIHWVKGTISFSLSKLWYQCVGGLPLKEIGSGVQETCPTLYSSPAHDWTIQTMNPCSKALQGIDLQLLTLQSKSLASAGCLNVQHESKPFGSVSFDLSFRFLCQGPSTPGELWKAHDSQLQKCASLDSVTPESDQKRDQEEDLEKETMLYKGESETGHGGTRL